MPWHRLVVRTRYPKTHAVILEPMAPVDFKMHLNTQLAFLTSSCQSFDRGFHGEAIRIATAIRVLIHDTRNQRSLLSHLNGKNIVLVSTCLDIASKMQRGVGQVQIFNGMGRYAPGSNPEYFPKLGGGMFHRDLLVDEWWNETVFILDPNAWVSRREIVVTAADKDGGAHVDAALTPTYERLVGEGGELGICVDEDGRESPITGHHYVALRQMGYELLESPGLRDLTR